MIKMDYVEIYFRDLKEEAQKNVLELYGIKKPEEMNLDITPLAVLDFENEELEE